MRLFTMTLACAIGAIAAVAPAGSAVAQLGPDMKLEDAGFVMRPAKTAAELDHIKRLPPRRFVSRVKNGQRYYLYADAELCKCVFVGNQAALQAYRDMRSGLPGVDNVPPSGVTPRADMIDDMNRDLSDMIVDGNILDYQF